MRAAQRARDGNVVAAKPREVALQRCPRRLSAHVRRRRRRQRAVRDADGRKRKHRRRGVGADSGTWKDKRRTDAQRQPAAAGTALGGRVVADTATAGHEECLTAAAGREEPCKRGRTGAVAAGDVVACDCDDERRGGVSAVVDVCRAAQPHDCGRVCAGGVGARKRHGVAVDGDSERHWVVHRRQPYGEIVRKLHPESPTPKPVSRHSHGRARSQRRGPQEGVGALHGGAVWCGDVVAGKLEERAAAKFDRRGGAEGDDTSEKLPRGDHAATSDVKGRPDVQHETAKDGHGGGVGGAFGKGISQSRYY